MSTPFSSDAPPLVSCVVVNFKMVNFLRHLLQSIQDAPPSFSYEFLLVDNASQDGIAEVVRTSFPWVHLIESPTNVGLGAGANLALAHAQGKFILFLNPDLRIEPGELEKWIAWMEEHPDVGISGPRLLNVDGTDQESCYRFPSLLIPVYRRTLLGKTPWGKRAVDRYSMKDLDRTQEHDLDWVLGAALLIRRDLLDKIGRFDERFFLYFEDSDLCRRAWLAGARVVYTPVAKIMHYYQRDSRKVKNFWLSFLNPITRIHIVSGIKYFLKYFGQPNPRETFRAKHASV